MYNYSETSRKTTSVIQQIIIVNILLWCATWISAWRGIDLIELFGLHYPQSSKFYLYQFVTHLFMHDKNVLHLAFNMFALYTFGRILETIWGPKRFLLFFAITGLGAAAMHLAVLHFELTHMSQIITQFVELPSPEKYLQFLKYLHYPTSNNELLNLWYNAPDNTSYANAALEQMQNLYNNFINAPTIGASGAVYGVLLAYGMLFPNSELFLIFIPIPIKAKFVVIAYGAIELWFGITQPGSNIAHFAHLGGMLFAFLLILYWKKNRKNFY